ncbi:MAG: 1-acyl-sn-glycerol-3-phosphate acyltransferase [Prevotellaceae bacterium]|nr:1-acyl-sn-glycerol-3-phosphate acyltransferase [Prevotellaceae bacterium]
MQILYRFYQLFIAAPLLLLVTIATTLTTIIGCTLGNARFWGYYPPMVWSRLMCWGFLLPVKVEGRELLNEKQSYVFVANHQGMYDIFLIYGFLGRSFRWMMKKSLRNIPLIGKASESAGHIFVDKSGPKAIHKTYEQGRQVLKHGVSLVVFPEGARTFTGHMAKFRRGAFQLADELQLPVVPVTIDGCFDVLPRQRGFFFLTWHPMRLIIHEPIMPETRTTDKKAEDIREASEQQQSAERSEAVQRILERSYEVIMRDLPARHQGFVSNLDQ